MKILLINRGYAHGGGAEAAVRGLAQLFSSSGHQISVLTLENNNGEPGSEKKEIQVHALNTLSHRLAVKGTSSLHNRFIVFLLDWVSLVSPIKVLRLIRELKPDVVHTHNLRGMGMLVPLCIRLGKGSARWVHTVHDIQLVYPSGVAVYPVLSRPDTFVYQLYSVIQKCIWGSPDFVISPSEFLVQFYRERRFFKNSKFEVVPNVGEANKSGTESSNQRNIDPKHVSILFIGALEESKGIHILIEALRQGGMKAGLDIVGEGSLRVILRQAQGHHVVLHGALPSEKIVELFSSALTVVVPSLTYENAPMVIVESLRAGVPVIASRVGGIPEYVQEGVTGWLVKPGSIDELRQRLELIVHEGISDDMRRNCVRKAIEIGVQAQNGYLSVMGGRQEP